ncbi:hypothetical protein S83_029408 [Arachis hypogaea]
MRWRWRLWWWRSLSQHGSTVVHATAVFGDVCAGRSCYNYRQLWAFCNRLPNKLYEKIKVAAPDHSQETRSHLGCY